MDIKCSVGNNGTNRFGDALNVQLLLRLNQIVDNKFSAAVPEEIALDGLCGPKTIAAIRTFQSGVLGWRPASCDGLVSPGKKTIAALNGNIDGPSGTATQPAVASSQTGSGGVAGSGSGDGPTAFRQGNYSSHTLGTGNLSMSGYGCALCTLTMGATSVGSRTTHWPASLLPKDLTPPQANSIILAGGGFAGSLLIMGTAAGALGMNYEEYGRSGNLGEADFTRLNNHVVGGKPVAAHVDYKKSSSGDHWILITSKNGDGSFRAIDPATGKKCTLRRPLADPANLRLKNRGEGEKTAILAGWPDGGGSANQQKYNVVRYGLLSRKVAT